MNRQYLNVIISLDYSAATALDQEGRLDYYDNFESLPDRFRELILEFMEKHLGVVGGPIMCLARLNDCSVSLRNFDTEVGPLRIPDVLPTSPGDILLELKVKAPNTVTIGLMSLLQLIESAEMFGADHQVVEEGLEMALEVGLDSMDDETDVICFLPHLLRDDCVSYVLITDEWRGVYKGVFKGIPLAQVDSLDIF